MNRKSFIALCATAFAAFFVPRATASPVKTSMRVWCAYVTRSSFCDLLIDFRTKHHVPVDEVHFTQQAWDDLLANLDVDKQSIATIMDTKRIFELSWKIVEPPDTPIWHLELDRRQLTICSYDASRATQESLLSSRLRT